MNRCAETQRCVPKQDAWLGQSQNRKTRIVGIRALFSAACEFVLPQRVTVRVTVVVSRVLPLVPVTVMVWFPTAALRPTVMVIVDVPAPVMLEGLKETELALPWPEAERVIAELKPPVAELVIVTWPEPRRAIETDVGFALSENPAFVPVTVSETVVVSTVLPEVPVTVTVYVPGVTEAPTVTDMTEVPAPVIEPGLNPIVTPVGWPDAVRPIAELKPPVTVLVMVVDPAPP